MQCCYFVMPASLFVGVTVLQALSASSAFSTSSVGLSAEVISTYFLCDIVASFITAYTDEDGLVPARPKSASQRVAGNATYYTMIYYYSVLNYDIL